MLSCHFESQQRSDRFARKFLIFIFVKCKIRKMNQQIVIFAIAIIFGVNLIFGLPVDDESQTEIPDDNSTNGTHKEL